MIITRTPFRVSFFGGGTDYQAWFEKNGGSVLSVSINKYCYITCRYLPPFFEHKNRIVWSKIESVKDVEEIQHPAVRAALQFMNVNEGVEVHHDGDLPARTGLGSSSSFSVGFLHALNALQGRMITKKQLAFDAINLEQNLLKENVGAQDQVAAAYGGFNRIDFGGPHKVSVHPISLSSERYNLLQDHLMLFFTGLSRHASEVAAEQVKVIAQKSKEKELKIMHGMVDRAIEVLKSDSSLDEFGRLLHESWQLKRSLTSQISNSLIDETYEAGRSAGALGGKLLGAGGGGFMLFFVKPEQQPKVKEKLKNLLYVPFRFENLGSQIIYYGPETNIA